MSWKPTDDMDREIRGWMKAKGWEVTRVNYDSERQVYAWRHDVRGGLSPTLRISRYVLEQYPAFVVLYPWTPSTSSAILSACARSAGTLSAYRFSR